jgi:predicted DsbA family dithiol-disulfide isomerase
MPLTIDVISDVVCPWCFIGKRKLERALELYRAEHPDAPAPEVRWHPFQLNPDMPAEGMTRTDYLTRKFGSPKGGPGYDRVRAAGAGVGIPFALDRIERQPNTLVPHSVIAVAAAGAQQSAVVEALFKAYFLDGADLTSADTLRDRAVAAGLDVATTNAALQSKELHGEVERADHQARQLGVQGVPFFIFNNKLAVSGAQDPEVLLGAMKQAEAPE